jgi:ornithine cyclodeaminase/alanine dehydrogenase-like protein (mu-crystallin family)
MATTAPGTLRYLAAADVDAAMPPLADRLALAERTMIALTGEAEMPPKIGVHPRPEGSFAHTMPAYLRGGDPAGAADLLGMKWVAGFGAANAALGLPAISAVILLNDATTGEPVAILDGAPITAHRTAAVSGVAIARFAPEVSGRAPRAALIGAGVQGSSHLPVLGHVLPGVELAIHDRHADRAVRLADVAETTAGIGQVRLAASVVDATDGADVVITAASFTTPAGRQALGPDAFTADALIVAIDYATLVASAVARDAGLFLVDDRGQFLANRDAGQFDGYPDPTATLGEAIVAGTPRPATGRVLVSHLGVGLADVIFGDAVLRRAAAAGLGTLLPR